MRNSPLAAAALLIVDVAMSVAASAEPGPNGLEPVRAKDLIGHLDLSVPQSPAFTILGVTPESVVRSDDLRTVAVGLLQGVDPEGHLQSGIALDVRPYLAFKGGESTLGDYQSSRFVRIASTL